MPTSRCKRSISFVLAFALLLASTLGMVHGTVHAPGLQQLEARAAQAACASEAPAGMLEACAGESAHGWLSRLFGHHDDEQCRLYDQLAGGCSPLGVPLVPAGLVLPHAIPHFFLAVAPCCPPALFNARGPPSNS